MADPVEEAEAGVGVTTGSFAAWRIGKYFSRKGRMERRQEKERLRAAKETQKQQRQADDTAAAAEEETAAMKSRLAKSFKYDTTSGYRFRNQADETQYRRVLEKLGQNKQLDAAKSVHANDIQQSILDVRGRTRESLAPAEQTNLNEMTESYIKRFQQEGRIGEAGTMGDYSLIQKKGWVGRLFNRSTPQQVKPAPSPAPAPVPPPEPPSFADAGENGLYKRVMNAAAKDGRTTLSQGDIHHYITQDQKPGLQFGAEDSASNIVNEERAARFMEQMRKENILGNESGVDGVGRQAFSFKPKVSVPEVVPVLSPESVPAAATRSRMGQAWDAFRGKKPEALKSALRDVEEVRVAENPGAFGKIRNFFRKPVDDFNVGESVARSTSGLGADATSAALREAAPEVMGAADTSLVRSFLGRAAMPIAVGLAGWDVGASIAHHEAWQTTSVKAGQAVGGLAVGFASAEVGAAVGAGIGAFFFGAGAVPGAAIGWGVGFVAGAVGGYYGGKWGGKIVEHYVGHAAGQQNERMQQYLNASGDDWKSGSNLNTQAFNDGFGWKNGKHDNDGQSALKEAHWAAGLGFENSTDLHLVMDTASKAHYASTEAFIDSFKNAYHASHPQDPNWSKISGSDLARFINDNKGNNINYKTFEAAGAGQGSGAAPRAQSTASVEDGMTADDKKWIEKLVHDEKNADGKSYFEANGGNMNKAVQAYMVDNHLYDGVPGHAPPGGDVDGIWGRRSRTAFAGLHAYYDQQQTKAADAQRLHDQQIADQQQQDQQKQQAAYEQQHQVRAPVTDASPAPKLPDGLNAADIPKVQALGTTRPVIDDDHPITDLRTIDTRTADDLAHVMTKIAQPQYNSGKSWLWGRDFQVYEGSGVRMEENSAFRHELKLHGDQDKDGAPTKRLYVEFKGDPALAEQFYKDLQATEDGLMVPYSQDLRRKQDQKYVSNVHILPGDMEATKQNGLQKTGHAIKKILTLGFAHDHVEDLPQHYTRNSRTGDLEIGTGRKYDKHHADFSADSGGAPVGNGQPSASLVPQTASGPNRKSLRETIIQQGADDYDNHFTDEQALAAENALSVKYGREAANLYRHGRDWEHATADPRFARQLGDFAQFYQERKRGSAQDLRKSWESSLDG